jgi:pSer/pThr/pTyr-binding forkhead associated (FHA) protein
MAKIHLNTPDGNAFEAELTNDRMSVGRVEGNDLVIPDSSVSSSHGEFINEGGAWVFNDLGSTNGTKVNGERVDRVDLSNGSQFEIGNVSVSFEDKSARAATSTQRAGLGGSAAAPTATNTAGYSNEPINRKARNGFGPPLKQKDGPRSGLKALGILAFISTIALIALLMQGIAGK